MSTPIGDGVYGDQFDNEDNELAMMAPSTSTAFRQPSEASLTQLTNVALSTPSDTDDVGLLRSALVSGGDVSTAAASNTYLHEYLRGELQYDQFVELSRQMAVDIRDEEQDDNQIDSVFPASWSETDTDAMQLSPVPVDTAMERSTVTTTTTTHSDTMTADAVRTTVARGRPKSSSQNKKAATAVSTPMPGDSQVASFVRQTDQSDDEECAPQVGTSKKQRRLRCLSPETIKQNRQKLSEELRALIGQANMRHAQGHTDEAVKLINEVIRQAPRHPEPYKNLAYIWQDVGDDQRAFEFLMFAAYLDPQTDGETWRELGDMCEHRNKLREALLCYSKAVKSNPYETSYYTKKIQVLESMGLSSRVLETRLLALRHMKNKWDWAFMESYARRLIEDLEAMDNMRLHALECRQLLLKRGRSEGHILYDDIKLVLDVYMRMHEYYDAAKCLFLYVPNIKVFDANNKQLVIVDPRNPHKLYAPEPFPPVWDVTRFEFDRDCPESLKSCLAVCFVHLRRPLLAWTLITQLLCEYPVDAVSETVVEFARFHVKHHETQRVREQALPLLEQLINAESQLTDKKDVWFEYASCLVECNRLSEACTAYERVLDVCPGVVDARLNLAAVQRRLGHEDKAVHTLLLEYDQTQLTGAHNERLLRQQAQVAYDSGDLDKFVTICTRLLAPYFNEVLKLGPYDRRKLAQSYSTMFGRSLQMSTKLTTERTALQRFVQRAMQHVNNNTTREMSAHDVHDACFRLCEVHYSRRNYEQMLHVCALAYAIPILVSSGRSKTFDALLYMAACLARNSDVAFEYLRTMSERKADSKLDDVRFWNSLAFVFSMHQDVKFHRYIFRQSAKYKDCIPLSILSGNNSLVAGTYHHALAEYLGVLVNQPDDVYVNLMTGLCFIHLVCKKHISRRHDVCLQGLAFLARYEELRGACQETYYNLGRAMHQLNLLHAAVHYYRKVLAMQPPTLTTPTGSGQPSSSSRFYDLRPCAAHNLALIYKASGNIDRARALLMEYCTV